MATISAYPASITINKLIEPPIDYPVTRYEYDDGGVDTNIAPCGLKRFLLTYEGLSATDFGTIFDHYNEAKGKVNTFDFTNPRDSILYTGVSYESFEVPDHTKSWSLNLNVVLRVYV